MPNTEDSVIVEVEVSLSRNKPANEFAWSNNIFKRNHNQLRFRRNIGYR
jgi:hypothetical protein